MSLDMTNLPSVEQVFSRIPPAERVRLAILLIRDVEDDTLAVPMKRLAREAEEAGKRLMRARFNRERGG